MKRNLLRSIPNTACYASIDSPVGELVVIVSQAGLHGIVWENQITHPDYQQLLSQLTLDNSHPLYVNTKTQLAAYFAGTRYTFDLPLALTGTDFQLRSWQQLCAIPYGNTMSYAEQAQQLGDKNKARAVGMANHVNPIPIIIPCHRVIGSNGQLTGFASGLERKQYLLALEKQHKQLAC